MLEAKLNITALQVLEVSPDQGQYCGRKRQKEQWSVIRMGCKKVTQ